jgi:hypothetical protein
MREGDVRFYRITPASLQALRQTARSESPWPSEKNATRRVLASLPTPPSIYAAPGHYMAATVAFLEEQQLTVP